ncbi:PEP-CTERM motif protein [Thalassoglobus neptunius]|uniref:PEP-CTERM motif protein n=1 Tax=Thalassoglobus neptunius TaxID=1938619 RepID=A0A5C5UW10_9PLAN|nr:PEP-CTERM sorting domain-containing protein [Thalassoglobus neptunius]TWT29545.1 PEP-CTERM motif protein [Thalassoglobus neptunius]
MTPFTTPFAAAATVLLCSTVATSLNAELIQIKPVGGKNAPLDAFISPGTVTKTNDVDFSEPVGFKYVRATTGLTTATTRTDWNYGQSAGTFSFSMKTFGASDEAYVGGSISGTTWGFADTQARKLKYDWSARGKGLTLQTPDRNGRKDPTERGTVYGNGTFTGFGSFYFDFFDGVREFDQNASGMIRYALWDGEYLGESANNADIWHEAVPGPFANDITGTYLAPVTATLGLTNPIFVGPAITEVSSLVSNVSAGLQSLSSLESVSTPEVVSYLFESFLNPITTLTLPEGFDSIEIEYGQNRQTIAAGETVNFGPGGVTSFSLLAPEFMLLSPDELSSTTLGFTFLNEGIADLQQTVVTESAATVPEPTSMTLFLLGSLGFGFSRRRAKTAARKN